MVVQIRVQKLPLRGLSEEKAKCDLGNLRGANHKRTVKRFSATQPSHFAYFSSMDTTL